MTQIRKYDEEMIKLYSKFLFNILNNKKSSLEYFRRLSEVKDEEEGLLTEKGLMSLIAKRDNIYIILSTQMSFGYIINISLGLAAKLGYHREELFNHSIDFLLPKIYYKYDQHVFKYTFNKLKEANKKLVNKNRPATSKL